MGDSSGGQGERKWDGPDGQLWAEATPPTSLRLVDGDLQSYKIVSLQ